MSVKDQYIDVVGNSEFYKFSRALTDKQIFEMVPLENLAMANLTDADKDILVQITEYDIMKNPAVIMTATKREEVIKKITERLDNLDQSTRDTYLILFSHWFHNKIGEGMENEGNAYCSISDIHFIYRKLTGKNKDSTLLPEQYESYIQDIDVLRNTRVMIDITKETNIAYEKIKSLGWTSIEGFLVNDVNFVYDKEKRMIGIWYNTGLIGDAYTKYIPRINKYPTALLKMDSKYATAKNIGNYLCYLRSCSQEKNEVVSKVNLFNLMGESRYELKKGRQQQGINRFLNNLKKAKELLIINKIIKDLGIPEDIHSKNYKSKHVTVDWDFDL